MAKQGVATSKTVWDSDKQRFESVEIIERNGNLTYCEFEDGRREWLAPFEFAN